MPLFPGIRGGWTSHQLAKISNEMSLIEITQPKGQLSQIDRHARLQLRDGFVEPVAIDHPFGPYADVLIEQSLQCAFGQSSA